MTAEIVPIDANAARNASPQLRTLVVCDIADSTALVERMGDQNAANIIRKHDRLARALVEKHRGHEIDKTDGFLLLFERPVQAAAFALDYQRGLKHMSAADGVVVRARVGIHMGDVVIWENAAEDVARGAKPIEVEGLAKPTAARLAQLARPQQILMSSAAAGIARRAERELGADAARHVHWKRHGLYRFKGLPEPLDVVEVGEGDVAPLHAPKSGRTAKKILPWWRRPATLVAEAAMLAIAVGVGGWLLLQSPPTLAFGARDWVVVGDLHNLTGDAVLDESVDSALRISLEQSQYVNVLPELSVRQTLQRMELDPDKASVNRAVGSQVALRDGARALILPTVADVGGRVRVTAEVIDPNTQATVYSVSADGIGAKSVLPSLDSVSKQLRGKLGEALAMVSKESMPLARVATPDLNALRAYSLGLRSYDSSDMQDALALFGQALRIDPHFALAHVAVAKVFEAENRPVEAATEIKAAQSDKGRLSVRDALYVDALAATFERPNEALNKWKLLASVYPDYYPGLAAYAYFLWNDANRYADAIPFAEQASVPTNPHRGTSEYLLGTLYVEAGKYADALRAFKASVANGNRFQNAYYASVYAAQRQFADAVSTMASGKHSNVAGYDIGAEVVRLAFVVDQGDWQAARHLLTEIQRRAKPLGDRTYATYVGLELSLDAIDGVSANSQDKALAEHLQALRKIMASSTPIDRRAVQFQMLLVGYFAARAGDVNLARQALAGAGPRSGSDTPIVSNLRGVAESEIARATGKPEAAIAMLKAQINGSELYVTHVAMLDAYADAGDNDNALKEALWLSSHRGRAYLESSQDQILAPFNVAESDLAILRAAGFAKKLGKPEQADTLLKQFEAIWPKHAQLPWLTPKLQALHAPA